MSVEFRKDSFAAAQARAGYSGMEAAVSNDSLDRRDGPQAACYSGKGPLLDGKGSEPGVNEVLDIGGAEISCDPGATQQVRDQALGLLANAIATQGPRALENPRSSTIFHEAGHAVVHAHFGNAVVRCKVWQIKRGDERGQWTGETVAGQDWKSDEATSAQQDFRRACCLIAGMIAELHFDHDNFRQASSIDERLLANRLAANAALKTGRDQRSVMMQVVRATNDILERNEDLVRKVAEGLERQGVLRKAFLTPLLAGVCATPSEHELN